MRGTAASRDAAIKVLSDAVTHNRERLARFEREARLLAALNHPHIAGILASTRPMASNSSSWSSSKGRRCRIASPPEASPWASRSRSSARSPRLSKLYPGEALVRVKGLPGRVLGDQIRSIDKSRLKSRIGVLSRGELLAVEAALQITLGLPAV